MDVHADELTPYANPRALDPVGDGFNRYFDDFIRHPDYAEQRAPQFGEKFSDLLDGQAPKMLADFEALQSLGLKAKRDDVFRIAIGT